MTGDEPRSRPELGPALGAKAVFLGAAVHGAYRENTHEDPASPANALNRDPDHAPLHPVRMPPQTEVS
jgi:hypothetical protein